VINGHSHWLVSGGIGSGKSVVRRVLAQANWHVVDADSVGHGVLDPQGPAFREVATRWPGVVVDGRVDRSALGRIVFADAGELDALEQITHPHIFGRIRNDIQGIDAPVAVEIPLLRNPFGSEWRRIVVDSSDEERLARLEGRGMSEEAALVRMRAQPSRSEWLAEADLVIPNHGSVGELEETVLRIAG